MSEVGPAEVSGVDRSCAAVLMMEASTPGGALSSSPDTVSASQLSQHAETGEMGGERRGGKDQGGG
jgi:hypothetical protein